MIDRTQEFTGCLKVLRRHSQDGLNSSASLTEQPNSTISTDFTQAVTHISAGLGGASKLNEQLMRLVTRKGNSNDPTIEIADVSRLFKEDMAAVQRELTLLQAYADGSSGRRDGPAAGSQRQKHCAYIVTALKQTAQQHMKSFQGALTQRTTGSSATCPRPRCRMAVCCAS